MLDQLLAGCVDYQSLRPDIWKLSHPDSIRTYRVEERRHAGPSAETATAETATAETATASNAA